MLSTQIQKREQEALQRARKKCRQKFLYYFPEAFSDQTYREWERNYKWNAHLEWKSALNRQVFEDMLIKKDFSEIASRAVKIETRTNLLFSFEKMALRDAVRTNDSAQLFSESLYEYVYGKKSLRHRFHQFAEAVSQLPRKQTRVLTWPLVTVFGFIANPKEYIFLKPNVTRIAAEKYKFNFHYTSKPSWETYENFLEFASFLRSELADWKPRDMIDIQSFMWVMGSDEYP